MLSSKVLAAPHPEASPVQPPRSPSRLRTLEGLRSESKGKRIDPSLRSELETRLGASFADVCVHSGPVAARLCGALGARAFTLGNDIFFAAGEYAPGTTNGRFLLAHELVHVLQQRAAGPAVSGTLLHVGDPLDPCEAEADQVAREALGSGRRSPVTPDPSGLIRRVVSINERSANITADYKDSNSAAAAGIDYMRYDGVEYAVLHLTRNKAEALKAHPNRDRVAAIRFTGTVTAGAESRAALDRNWEFHFMQFYQQITSRSYYAGQTRSEGYMYMDFAAPSTRQFMLDCDGSQNNFTPYADLHNQIEQMDYPFAGQWRAQATYTDHPETKLPMILTNPVAMKPNYLFHITQQYRIVSALVAVDSTDKTARSLCWMEWGAWYDCMIHWYRTRSGPDKTAPRMIFQKFYEPKLIMGEPPYSDVRDLILTPGRQFTPNDTANEILKLANNAVYDAIKSPINTSQVQTVQNWDMKQVPSDHCQ